MMALDALSSAVPPEMISTVASRDTAKEAWEAIKVMRVGDNCVRASTAPHLLRQFENATFKEGESIEDFSISLSGMVWDGSTSPHSRLEEPKVVGKFLRSVPHQYRQIVVAIQSLLDIDKLTLANVTGWLKVAKDELKAPPPTVSHAGKLYLSKEAWVEKWKARDSKKPSGDGSGGRGGGRRGGRSNRGRENGGNHDADSSSSQGRDGPARLGKNQCKHYFKNGHWGHECRNRPKTEAAHVAQEEEALMMVTTTIASKSSPITVPTSDSGDGVTMPDCRRGPMNQVVAPVEQRKQLVHLHEERIFVQLRPKEERVPKI
jgi:hypothetical protein